MRKLAAAWVLGTVASLFAAETSTPEDLIPLLGSTKFYERDDAHKKLAQLLDIRDPKTVGLLRKALKHDDPEVSRRAQILLKQILREECEAEMKRKAEADVQSVTDECRGKLPWIDGFPQGHKGIQVPTWQYLSRHHAIPGAGAPHWRNYREATRDLLLDLARQGIDIKEFVPPMKNRESRWIEQFGAGYKPPIPQTWEDEPDDAKMPEEALLTMPQPRRAAA